LAKYQRKRRGSWTISSTSLGWGVTGIAVLLVGFFLTGLYIGYGMGTEEGKQQLREEIRTSGEEGEISDQIAQLIDRQQSQGSDTSAGARSQTTTDNQAVESDTSGPGEGAFTEEDLGFLGEEGNNQAADGANAPSEPENQSQNQESTGTSPTNDTGENTADDLYPGSAQESGTSDESGGETVNQDSESSPYDYDRSSDTGELESFFTIQTVSFQRQDYARQAADKLRTAGHSVMVNETLVNDTTYFRVRVGAFTTRSQAREYADEMIDRGEIEDYWISKVERGES